MKKQKQPSFREQLGRHGGPVYNKLGGLGREAFALLVTRGCEPVTLIGLLMFIAQKASVRYASRTEVNPITEDQKDPQDLVLELFGEPLSDHPYADAIAEILSPSQFKPGNDYVVKLPPNRRK